MTIAEALKDEAERRGLLTGALGAEEAFYLVRDMPYKRASSREPLVTVREWRGTCSGKHYLLKEVFQDLGFAAWLMACPQYVAAEAVAELVPAVKALLEEGPIPDVHNYLELETPQGRMKIDATFPLAFARLGLPVNERFNWGQDMTLACVPITCYVVPEDGDPQAFKEKLLRQHFSPAEVKRREAFFKMLAV